jgi:hypothetical protein
MRRVIFYSWQSDLPNATNRSLIQQALENVAKAIKVDDTVDIEPVIDRDTQGVAGAPDIAKTIFQKIASADVVVADVSIIGGRRKGRPTPNPNILIELGYAMHALGDERVILVFNMAFGKLEQLPFDLKMRRSVSYNMPQTAEDRATERRTLEAKLHTAVREALASVKIDPPRSLVTEAIEAVERVAPNRVIVIRRFLSELLMRLEAKRPKSVADGATAEEIEEAILRTEDITLDYARLAEAVAAVGDEESARSLYRGFGPVLELYDPPQLPGGLSYAADADFMKFHGHELFCVFIGYLIREERWELVSKLLDEGITVRYRRKKNGPDSSLFDDISEYLVSCDDLGKKRRSMSVHADILKALFDPNRELGRLIPFEDFKAADYFLFLRAVLAPEQPTSFIGWRPWSARYLESAPGFIRDAQRSAVAECLVRALRLPDISTLQKRLFDRAGRLDKLFGGWWDQPLSNEDIARIGTR